MKHIRTLALALALPTAAAAQTLPETTINVIGNLGITTQSQTLEAPFWTSGITEASNGAIKTNFRTMNEMGLKGGDMFGMLTDGVMNITTGQLGHHTGADPFLDATDLAGLSPTMEEFREVSEAFKPALTAYMRDEMGLHLIALQSYQNQVLYCRDEIGGLSDLQGLRVRTSGASQIEFIEHFGGTGVNVSFGEVQQALEQGVVDCAITGSLGGYSAKWYEAANYIYTLPINFGAGATVANAAWWDGLDPALQEFLTTEISALSDKMWELNLEENTKGYACNSTGPCELGEPAGMTRVDPSDKDIEMRREALVETVLPGWVARCGDICKTAFNENLADVTGLTID